MPPDRRPRPDAADVAGGIGDIVARFAALRAETDAALTDTPDAELARPSMRSGVEVDVRHRLHRFASHEGRIERERLHALDAALAQKAQLATPSR